MIRKHENGEMNFFRTAILRNNANRGRDWWEQVKLQGHVHYTSNKVESETRRTK